MLKTIKRAFSPKKTQPTKATEAIVDHNEPIISNESEIYAILLFLAQKRRQLVATPHYSKNKLYTIYIDIGKHERKRATDRKKFVILDTSGSVLNNARLNTKFTLGELIHEMNITVQNTEDNLLEITEWPSYIKRSKDPRQSKRYCCQEVEMCVELIRSSGFHESEISIEDVSSSGCKIYFLNGTPKFTPGSHVTLNISWLDNTRGEAYDQEEFNFEIECTIARALTTNNLMALGLKFHLTGKNSAQLRPYINKLLFFIERKNAQADEEVDKILEKIS